MRNAATFDDDLGYESAARKAKPRKSSTGTSPGRARAADGPGRGKALAKRPRFDLHRVARFVAIGMAATMATGIMVNALVLQKGHHPAPLFGKTTTSVASIAAPVPAGVARVQSDETAAVAQPAPAKSRKTVVATRDTDAPASDDMIGKFLSGGQLPTPAKAKGDGKTDGKLAGTTVMGAQRALTKLGFKVPATGGAGPATKKAIEAFEKDRHLPVKGELNRKLVKVLAAESGIKID